MISLEVNGKKYEIEASSDVPLLGSSGASRADRYEVRLWEVALRCLYRPYRMVRLSGPCQIPVRDVLGKRIITIEGIPEDHPVKKAWNAVDVPQCGYCQPGQIMDAAALLEKNPHPRMLTLTPLCLATSVAAGPISAFVRRFTLLPK